MSSAKLSLLSFFVLAGCITSSPDKPSMTAAEHEQEARRAEQVAQEHENRRDPGLYVTQRCGSVGPAPNLAGATGPGPSTNNTASSVQDPCFNSIQAERDHELEAERLRWIAAKHRAAAAKIRGTQAMACGNLSSDELLASPLERREDVMAVRAMPDYGRTGKASSQRGGATVLVKAQPGMDAETLQRLITCDIARAAAEGGDRLERSPWSVPGAEAVVTETDDGLLVEVTARDRKTAQEIIRRARALSAPHHE